MQRLTSAILFGILAILVFVGCKSEESHASTNLSPIHSPLPTIAVTPRPGSTIFPTRMITYVILPTPNATPGPWVTVNPPPGQGPGGTSIAITKVVVLGTLEPTPTILPLVQPFGTNGLLVNLRPNSEPVLAHVGQQLVVKEPAVSLANQGWNVIYDPTILQLAANVNLTRPSAEGWKWTIQRPGTITITFQTKVPPCTTPPHCPDFPFYRNTLVLQVSP